MAKSKLIFIRLSNIFNNINNSELENIIEMIEKKFTDDFVVLVIAGENNTEITDIKVINL